jgi:arsenite methyltransferase
MMEHAQDIDPTAPEFGDLYDELPLWSAPFGLLLLERLPLRPGLSILDVGTGTGFLALELAQRCGPQARVIAVDPWATAVQRLRRKVAHRQIDNVSVLEQDAAALDLPEASIDLVVSNLGINNFDHPDAVLRTCFRVAKPGAQLFLTTNTVGHMREFYEIYRATLVELGMTDRLATLDAHIAHRGTLESIGQLVTGAGFEVVDAVTSSFRMRFADGSALLRHWFIRLGFVPAWKSIVAADSVAATFVALERKLNAVAAQRGDLALTIPMLCIEARKPAAA